jgi:hypothetical protein
MDRVCSTNGEEEEKDEKNKKEENIGYWWEIQKERDH